MKFCYENISSSKQIVSIICESFNKSKVFDEKVKNYKEGC
jgi:hypothetical protein